MHGPYWFAGPDFKIKHEIYEAKPQNRNSYADNFLTGFTMSTVMEKTMSLLLAFRVTPAYVYENPGPGNYDTLWDKHQVFDWVSNESPWFIQLVGDDTPELVCTRMVVSVTQHFPRTNHLMRGSFTPSPKTSPRNDSGMAWESATSTAMDGWMSSTIMDGLNKPEDLSGNPEWKQHLYTFTKAGGAEMYAYDVDGDGDNDVISSLAAHSYGLVWFEQIKKRNESRLCHM